MRQKANEKKGKPTRPPLRRRALGVAGIALALLLGLWLLDRIHPLPPREMTLACGPQGSAYEVFGKRYQKLLAKQGIQLHLRTTAGGVENLALLNKPDSGVDLGFVEGGIAPETDDGALASLGTLGYEPIWIFSRRIATDRQLPLLKGKRVSVGPEGSASRALFTQLGRRRALDTGSFKLLTETPEDSADELEDGSIDALVLVNSWASPVVRKLVKTKGIVLTDFQRADAYAAHFPSLTQRVIPEGAASLPNDIPSHTITLLATKTSLIARASLHPTLQYLILEMLAKVHGRSGIFQKADEFPAPEALEIPLSAEATHFYKSGQPFLQRYLPFWLAALAEQLVILLIPLLGLTYPLIKGLMALYGWSMQRRIYGLYGELHFLETELNKVAGRSVPVALELKMATLEAKVSRVKVAKKYMPLLYTLKESLHSAHLRMKQGRWRKGG